VIVVDTAEEKNRWWSAEQVLRANSAGALLFWPRAVNDAQTRRLQLAAQESQSLAFVFTGTARAAQPSPSPLRIRLSLAEEKLRIDVFKCRGGVMTRPLLLDVAASSVNIKNPMSHAMDDAPLVTAIVKPMMKIDRLPIHRSASFKSQYPVGGLQAKIWDRALARADEVSRVPGVDPRSVGPRGFHSRGDYPNGVVLAKAETQRCSSKDNGFPLSRE
jgi:hypothetical protein